MFRMIDADVHMVEPPTLWQDYVEPEFRDRVIQIRRGTDGKDEFWVNAEQRRAPGDSIAAAVIPGGYLDPERTRTATWEDILPGSWDPHERVKVLDAEGIDASFLYPSFHLLINFSAAARISETLQFATQILSSLRQSARAAASSTVAPCLPRSCHRVHRTLRR